MIVETAEQPVYQRIAAKAKHLRELGMSDKAIARALGVSDKTVTRAIDLEPSPDATRSSGESQRRETCALSFGWQ
jgi:predicted transcriptional regulator